jgi:hypothetical protein
MTDEPAFEQFWKTVEKSLADSIPDEATRQSVREFFHKEMDGQLRTVMRQTIGSRKEFSALIQPHYERETFYETRAIDFANNALKTLTYLNGGALVAIPAAVALFAMDAKLIKTELLTAATLLVVGLFFVLLAQAFWLFTMSQRANAEDIARRKQDALITAVNDEKKHLFSAFMNELVPLNTSASNTLTRASIYQLITGVLFWGASGCFVIGCFYGARALMAH